MMTFPAGLNLTRCALHNRGEHGASQPQQVLRSRSSTEGRCHSRGPLPLMPVRTKSDPGLNTPAMRNRYRLERLIRSWLDASAVVAQ